jgi:hypothetical protein
MPGGSDRLPGALRGGRQPLVGQTVLVTAQTMRPHHYQKPRSHNPCRYNVRPLRHGPGSLVGSVMTFSTFTMAEEVSRGNDRQQQEQRAG